MIVIGSYALAALGLRPFAAVKDIDLIGTEDDVRRFRSLQQSVIVRERDEHGHRQVFHLKDGQPWDRVEIDFEQAASDRMLPALCKKSVQILGMQVQVPPLEVLYLIKRAHANVPVHYDKTIRDIIQLKPLSGSISGDQQTFYLERKSECQSRYNLNRQRFSLSVPNEDFFDLSDHVRTYVHDDLHEAVAHEPNRPLYKRCKRDLSLAKIDVDLFEALSMDDRLRMVQEEFMVIGLERFYLHDKALTPQQVYRKGMHKTVRDLFVGYFQDFCIDHIVQLLQPPRHDFVGRFEAALRAGRIREVEIKIPPASDEHKRIWLLINEGALTEARRRSEDLVRRADAPGDTHAFFLLGVVMLKNQEFSLASKCLKRCLARDRKNRLAWFYLGVVFRMTGQNDAAIEHFERARDMGLKIFGLYWNSGLAYEAAGRSSDAIQAYTEALRYQPESQNLQQRLAALKPGLPATPDTA